MIHLSIEMDYNLLWASLIYYGLPFVAQLVKNPSAMREAWARSLGRGKSPGEGIGYPLQYSWASLCGSAGKESTCNVGDLGSIPGLGRSPGKGKGYPLQCSGLENSMDCIVHEVTKSWTQLSHFHFHHFNSFFLH